MSRQNACSSPPAIRRTISASVISCCDDASADGSMVVCDRFIAGLCTLDGSGGAYIPENPKTFSRARQTRLGLIDDAISDRPTQTMQRPRMRSQRLHYPCRAVALVET